MIVLSVLLVVALAATVIAFLIHGSKQEEAWSIERRELLNRIQHPQHLPTTPAVDWASPDPEPDEIGMVGTITYDPEGD